MNILHKKLSVLICFILIITPMFTIAQFDDIPVEPDVPIDGGLSLLIAAGVGFGIKKIRQNKIINERK